ncbi:MAG: VWA domain-containing protein [Alphaproteobacteria bacterium]|nr:VWA domain-containing protein [Alphaproteobacteria bacterium]
MRDEKGTLVPNSPEGQSPPAERSTDTEIADFLSKVKTLGAPAQSGSAAGSGRLIFAMDATMSRQPTWDMALSLQSEMFVAVRDVGGLDVQLIYFRGFNECRSSKWVSEPMALQRLMTAISCQGGHTQIRKVLSHARQEAGKGRVDALVFVGDAMEENIDDLCARAGELGLLGVPMFLFQEGYNVTVENAFKELARLTKGAWCRFDSGSAAQLKELLTAVAVYAAGGRQALKQLGRSRGAQLLLEQLEGS